MSEIAIKVEQLGKRYYIGKQVSNSLRNSLAGVLSTKGKHDEFWALKDVNFQINQGDVVGIIGRNGAGKSTLLKTLSQITRPTTGRIELHGRVASLLEVGTGFHPELTGRENIYLNGTILGMSRKEVAAKFDEIVDFSGIEKFIDTPVKHYSSGMYVRLGFAVAAHLEPEILIIDEVLAVGDAEFQKKCLGKMQDVAGHGRTVLFVSHNISSIKSLCTKGILLENGLLSSSGEIENIVSLYQKSSTLSNEYVCEEKDSELYLKMVKFNAPSNEFYYSDTIEIQFKVEQKNIANLNYCLLLRIIDEYESVITSAEVQLSNPLGDYRLQIEQNVLKKGNYSLNIILYQPAICQFDNVNCCNFQIIDNNPKYSHLEGFDIGNIYLNEKWL